MTMQDSWSIRVRTPSATIFVHVTESNGKIDTVLINAGKTGAEVAATCQALAAVISRVVKEDGGLEKVLSDLSSITTDKSILNDGNITCRSIPEGIYLALLRYSNEKFEELRKSLGGFRQ